MEKIETKQLRQVQATLLLPLAARVIESRKVNGIIKDTQSIEIAEKLQVNINQIGRKISPLGVSLLATRAYKFDQKIRSFLAIHPHGKILTLGAGLDTSFFRCDNGLARWYDLDLADSMTLRKSLLSLPEDRVTTIAKSLFDISWIEDIGSVKDGLLIQIPGVLPYFKEEEVKNFLKVIAPRLKGAEVIFDVISKFGIVFVNSLIHAAGMKDANILWGIVDTSEIARWSPHIQVDAEPFFHQVDEILLGDLTTRIFTRISDFLRSGQIVSLNFI